MWNYLAFISIVFHIVSRKNESRNKYTSTVQKIICNFLLMQIYSVDWRQSPNYSAALFIVHKRDVQNCFRYSFVELLVSWPSASNCFPKTLLNCNQLLQVALQVETISSGCTRFLHTYATYYSSFNKRQ